MKKSFLSLVLTAAFILIFSASAAKAETSTAASSEAITANAAVSNSPFSTPITTEPATGSSSVDKITGKITDSPLALDGNEDTFASIELLPKKETFELYIYLKKDAVVDKLEMLLSSLPAEIQLAGGSDIVNLSDLPTAMERNPENNKFRIKISVNALTEQKFLRLRISVPDAKKLDLYELFVGVLETTENKISSINVEQKGDHSVVVTYQTEHPAQTHIRYGALKPTFDQVFIVRERAVNHTAKLENLLAGTLYFFQILSDKEDRMSEVKQFTTTGEPLPLIRLINMPPPLTDSASVELTANKSVKWRVRMGLYTGAETVEKAIAATVTADISSPTMTRQIAIPFTGLQYRSRYYFFVEALDEKGNTTTSDLLGFDTAPLNYALGRPVTGTFDFEMADKYITKTDKPMQRITDGDINYHTGFAKSQKTVSGEQWAQIDLGEQRNVAEILLIWSSLAIPVTYTLETSPDGKKWEPLLNVKDKTGNPARSEEIQSERGDPLTSLTLNADKKVKLIKLTIPAGSTIDSRYSWRYAILAEILALAPPPLMPPPPPNVLLK